MDLILDQRFTAPEIDPRLRWINPPAGWSLDPESGRLIVAPIPGSDFWQQTHNGLSADDGHLLALDIEGDIVLETAVRFHPANQYDQAGLMLRFSPACWVKASVEYEPDGPARLGAVVTSHSWSDWSTQDFPPGLNEVALRLTRTGQDCLVEFALPGNPDWTQIRQAHLHEGRKGPWSAGLYACSPKGPGFRADFEYLRITKP